MNRLRSMVRMARNRPSPSSAVRSITRMRPLLSSQKRMYVPAIDSAC